VEFIVIVYVIDSAAKWMSRNFPWRKNSSKRRAVVHHVREIQQAQEKYYTEANGKKEEPRCTRHWLVVVLEKLGT